MDNPNDMPDGFRPGDPTAPTRASTDHAEITFTMKEGGQGEPRLMIEFQSCSLPVLEAGDAFLMLLPSEGVTYEQLEALRRQMNDLIGSVSYTKFVT